jgi:SsrA-binding protein
MFFSIPQEYHSCCRTFKIHCLPYVPSSLILIPMAESVKMIAQNKKARFNYSVEESVECGIALEGTEVKSVKAGNISFPDAFAEIIHGEVWVHAFHISEYAFSSIFNHDPDRPKKLLLHKDEIKRLQRKVEEKGYTLIPLDFYLKKGRVKVNLGVCKGKKMFDKRAGIRERDVNRDLQREFRKGLES